MAAIGLGATLLQIWLWQFPMEPDPSGKDPNGVTTAPFFWRIAHRVLGYLFAGCYAILLFRMVPRIWTFVPDAWSARTTLHATLGLVILPLLVYKISIIRRFQRHGKLLPTLGIAIWASCVAAIAFVAPVANHVASGSSAGAQLVSGRCFSCHGAGLITEEDGDLRDWLKIVDEMKENASEMGRPDPADGDAAAIAEHLRLRLPDRN